jgi:hypothetical protein
MPSGDRFGKAFESLGPEIREVELAPEELPG